MADEKKRSKEELQSDITETRERFISNLDALKAQLTPQALAERAKATVREVFVDTETGAVRTERVAVVGVSVVGFILVRKGLKARARRKELERLKEIVWVPVPKIAVGPEIAPLARTAKELGPGPVLSLVDGQVFIESVVSED